MDATSRHGGRRPGAGRKPSEKGRMRKVAITLPDADVDYLRAVGEGNISSGVRRLIREISVLSTPAP